MSVNENQPVYRGEQRVDFKPADFYLLPVLILQNNPVDAQVVYAGSAPRAPLITAGISKIDIPYPGTITKANIWTYANSAVGTNESWRADVRLNNTTDYQIASLTLATAERRWKNYAMSVSVAADDFVEIKFTNPNPGWATNPTSWLGSGWLYVQL